MQRWFDVKKTQLEMMQDRGYAISPAEQAIFDMNLSQFINYLTQISEGTRSRQALSNTYVLNTLSTGAPIDEGPQECYVFFGARESADNKLIPVGVIHKFTNIITAVNEEGRPRYREAVLIVDAAISPQSKANLLAVKTVPYQIFHDSDLTYNPVQHVSVPRHELLSESEARMVLGQLRVDQYRLLLIYADDPVIRYYGWQSHRIVRVYRDDSAVNTMNTQSINYRLIIDTPKSKK